MTREAQHELLERYPNMHRPEIRRDRPCDHRPHRDAFHSGDATASLAATVASAAGTDNYMSVDGEIIEFSGISGAGPYTYTLRTRNITAQDGNLTTHASGTKVGFFDLIHHNPRAYTRVFTETLRQATNPGSLAALPHWQQSPSLA
jgi:hypothetical protein